MGCKIVLVPNANGSRLVANADNAFQLTIPKTSSLMFLFPISVATGATICAGLAVWRYADRRHDTTVWRDLAKKAANDDEKVFATDMIKDLPEPAQRFFRFAIKPGTPLRLVSEISMDHGMFSLGDKGNPNYMPMTCTEIIAAPFGFVWKASVAGMMSGSDGANVDAGESWMCFWAYNLFPVARVWSTQNRDKDHLLSAFGRYVAEAIFWCPASVLPGKCVTWEAVKDKPNSARMTMTYKGLSQSAEITVEAKTGELQQVVFSRWTNANPDKVYQRQPFGGYTSEFKEFDGYTVPTRVEAGNYFGTNDYFPFFIANVSKVQFLSSPSSSAVAMLE